MKKLRGFEYLALALGAFVIGCSPTASQLKKTIEENPDIVFGAMEKNPDKFIEVLQKVEREGQAKAHEREEKDEKARMDKEFTTPLVADLPKDRAYRGDPNAPILVVEYSDFQCPYCKRGFETMNEVSQKYGPKIRFIYKHLPLPMHPMAMPAAKRFEAIALQNPKKAYEFHDQVFSHQDQLNSGGEKFLDNVAQKLGVNVGKMKTDMNSEKVNEHIHADMAEAEKFGISGTPGFLVGGVSIRGAYPFQAFQEIIDRKLKDAKN